MYNLLVSVIIPNYNHARFLDERIRSVLNQTYQNFELIILDDKSTDDSVEIINKYKDNPHVSHIILNKENSGSTFKQWHKGFELAKGDVVWIAESDDSCETTMLETLVRGYVEHDAVLAFCRSCRYDVDGGKSLYVLQKFLPSDMVMSGREFISNYMVQYNAVANASSAIFNRNVAMSIDKQYMSMRGEGDWLFWIELMEQGNVCFYDNEMNFFRFHTTNTTDFLLVRGIGDIEHKKIFNYLVNHQYLVKGAKRKERIRYVDAILYRRYDTDEIRRSVLKVWDRWRIARLNMFCSFIKRDILFLIKNW